jgi:hypothetical protein
MAFPSEYRCSCGERFQFYKTWERHVDKALKSRYASPFDHLLTEQPAEAS